MISAALTVAGAAGLFAGVTASLASRFLKRRLDSRNLWLQMQRCIRTLTKETDGRRFVQTYLLLLRQSGRFVSLQLLTATVAIIPVITAYLSSSVVSDALTGWKSGCLVIMPAATTTISTVDGAHLLHQGQHNYQLATDSRASVEVSIEGVATVSIAPLRKQGYSDSVSKQFLLTCLGFDRLQLSAPNRPSITLLISRPSNDDSNPLWPWLNDAEFLFIVAASAGSIIVTASAFRRIA